MVLSHSLLISVYKAMSTSGQGWALQSHQNDISRKELAYCACLRFHIYSSSQKEEERCKQSHGSCAPLGSGPGLSSLIQTMGSLLDSQELCQESDDVCCTA